MHILFLTDNFPPEVNAPASRTFEHCREWVQQGHRVTVITGVPNFPCGVVFPGYRNRWLQRESMEKIEVIRVWTYITANERLRRRILDYMSFMLSAVLAAPRVDKVDVVIGTSPQFFTVCAAWWVARRKRVPFIFELRDLWPESITALGVLKSSWPIRLVERTAQFLYREADLIVSVTRSFTETLAAQGIDAQKMRVITNGVDTWRFSDLPRDEALAESLGLSQKFVVGYVGTIGLAHGLEVVLESARMARDRGHHDIQFLILGDGAKKKTLREQAMGQGLDNVVFVDSVPKEEVVHHWALLDVALVHLRPDPLFHQVIPSKIFEAMAMGRPILHGVAGESADIVRETGAGWVFASGDAEGLLEGVLSLKSDPVAYQQVKQRALAAASRFDRKHLALTMLGEIEQVVASDRASRS